MKKDEEEDELEHEVTDLGSCTADITDLTDLTWRDSTDLSSFDVTEHSSRGETGSSFGNAGSSFGIVGSSFDIAEPSPRDVTDLGSREITDLGSREITDLGSREINESIFERQITPDSETSHVLDRRESSVWYWGVRLPLQMMFTCLLLSQLLWYFAFRWLVRFMERWCVSRSLGQLKSNLENAKTYQEWLSAAAALDQAAGCNNWRAEKRSREYVSGRVEAAIKRLQRGMAANDAELLMKELQICFKEPNFAGILNEELYSRTHLGTKLLVEEYLDSVTGACGVLGSLVKQQGQQSRPRQHTVPNERAPLSLPLNLLNDSPSIRCRTALMAETAIQSFGETALCLSGGGAMALQHLGVCSTLLQQHCLPRVISGTSGGGLAAALLCTRTDEELKEVLTPEYMQPRIIGFRDSWPTRILRYMSTGHLFDPEIWLDDMKFFCNDDMTFLEAYRRTGRVLNITASARKPHNVPLVLNYRSTPHVLIRSAVLCSSAMPIFIKAPRLLEKRPSDGQIVEAYSEEGKHAPLYQDGSIDCDIPAEELRVAFGVRFTIVSQVNPHVLPFRFDLHGDPGAPILQGSGKLGTWRGGFLLSGLVMLVKEYMVANLRLLSQLHLVPQLFDTRWDLMWAQQYKGDINLGTTGGLGTYLWKVRKALSNPTMQEMQYWWHEGEKSCWPKLARIHARMRQEGGLFTLREASGLPGTPRGAVEAMAEFFSTPRGTMEAVAELFGTPRGFGISPDGLSTPRRSTDDRKHFRVAI